MTSELISTSKKSAGAASGEKVMIKPVDSSNGTADGERESSREERQLEMEWVVE